MVSRLGAPQITELKALPPLPSSSDSSYWLDKVTGVICKVTRVANSVKPLAGRSLEGPRATICSTNLCVPCGRARAAGYGCHAGKRLGKHRRRPRRPHPAGDESQSGRARLVQVGGRAAREAN